MVNAEACGDEEKQKEKISALKTRGPDTRAQALIAAERDDSCSLRNFAHEVSASHAADARLRDLAE